MSNRLFVRQRRTASLPSNVHAVKLDAVLYVYTAPPHCSLVRRKKSACVVEWKRSVCVRVCEMEGGQCRCVSVFRVVPAKQSKQRYDDTARTASSPYASSQVGISHASTHIIDTRARVLNRSPSLVQITN